MLNKYLKNVEQVFQKYQAFEENVEHIFEKC